jgi:hypothetical protein
MNKQEQIIRKIGEEVESEYEMGGLSSGLYMDFATEVAIRYAKSLTPSVDVEKVREEFNRYFTYPRWLEGKSPRWWYSEEDSHPDKVFDFFLPYIQPQPQSVNISHARNCEYGIDPFADCTCGAKEINKLGTQNLSGVEEIEKNFTDIFDLKFSELFIGRGFIKHDSIQDIVDTVTEMENFMFNVVRRHIQPRNAVIDNEIKLEAYKDIIKEFNDAELEGKGYDFYFSIRAKIDAILALKTNESKEEQTNE